MSAIEQPACYFRARNCKGAEKRIGFEIVGRKGSHVRLKRVRDKEILIVIVPMHGEVAKGTLKSIMRQANLTVEDLLRLL